MISYSVFRGTTKCLAQIRKLKAFTPDHFADALKQEVNEVEVPECKRRCPVEEGVLRDSIHSIGPTRKSNRVIEMKIVAGEPGSGAEEYALIIHEDLDLDHPAGGEAKFIERPLKESAPHMPARIAKRIDLNKAK